MLENFTDDAREVLRLASLFARHCRHDHIGTGHLLFGVTSSAGQGQAAKALDVLTALGTAPQLVRDFVLGRLTDGNEPSPRHLPFTQNTKQVLEYALRSAIMLGSNHIGAEHLLAGLARNSSSTAGQLLADLGITDLKVEAAIRDSTPAPSPTAARTFGVYVPVGKSIFKNGGKVYPDLATAEAAHPGQEIAPFPLQLTDGEFFDVGAALPENRFKSWGSFASYPDAFTAAEQFRKNSSGYEIVIRIATPVTTEHRGKDADGRDVILGRTVSYDRVRVTSRVLSSRQRGESSTPTPEGASLV
ncbi:Clp protease N-terminal domain-containing protein [Pseudarthrobacter sp. BIM B-2242]|uniref:Clp protease N-terminal domain-containing protein n=1 Tax=Pseudarthrobacter sp. BIM B-2242 TaxID=2772401 RepID=UPI00168BA7EB|nr:Clp protease N-terminal domain-containing protein [Pseudarthrobacter sp. BIM B-2242]QOD06073.1 Clp protease [Pseudarthrobacter sp. BIM B-2242]